ncbi:capsule biosynthesis protein [Sandarakinorhabdus sp.]|uniref:capsule biosynthesis protein n=1 Tax=Sandarakinorhabdus sp. TaxID=1916663 RepID=UPI003F71D91A
MTPIQKWTTKAKRNPWFLAGVVLPVLVSALYFFLIAADQYVSESRFVIKSPNQRGGQVSTFANLIQTTGLSGGQEQAEQVIDYVRSRSALQTLNSKIPVKAVYARPGVDFLSRFPAPWDEDAFEDLYDYYKAKAQISRDNETGLIVLRTLAFTAKDARDINEQLLSQSEALVNELNERARRRQITEAESRVVEAEERVTAARRKLAGYRNQSQLVDPLKQATGVVAIADRLITERAVLEAQLDTLRRLTPDNPSIPALRQRIASLDQEINLQTARIVGGTSSISGKLPGFEALALEQEFASQMLTLTRSSLEQARTDAVKQQFYLERVVNPNEPDLPEYPHAFRNVLTILGFALCLYFIIWMFVVGILEHAPED